MLGGSKAGAGLLANKSLTENESIRASVSNAGEGYFRVLGRLSRVCEVDDAADQCVCEVDVVAAQS